MVTYVDLSALQPKVVTRCTLKACGYMWVVLLSNKNSVVDAIKKVQAVAERKSGNLLGALQTDRGGEFTTSHFRDYCAELGVRRKLTAPYTPQQNGVVERRN
jgi:transposase InsO family protein